MLGVLELSLLRLKSASFFVLSVISLLVAMTDTTDDIAEEISFQSFDDDCRLLGNLLNDILQREVGNTCVDKLERIRVLAQVKVQTPNFFWFCFIPFFVFFNGVCLLCMLLLWFLVFFL